MAKRNSKHGFDLKEYAGYHCPNCSYPLEGITRPACPECGKELKPGEVFKQRKYPGVIMLPGWVGRYGAAVLILLVAYAYTMGGPHGVSGGFDLILWFAGIGTLLYAIHRGRN